MKESKVNKRMMMLVGVVSVVLIIMMAAIFGSLVVRSGPTDYTPISKARPGQEVRLWGVINGTTDGTAFTLTEVKGDWALSGSRPFLLQDLKDPSSNITVDVYNCKDFSSDARAGSSDATSTYLEGDKITVVGKVSTNSTGARVVEATMVRSYYSKPLGLVTLIPIMILPMVMIGAIFYFTITKRSKANRRFHQDFLITHAGKPLGAPKIEAPSSVPVTQMHAPGELNFTKDLLGPPPIVEWVPNKTYKKNMFWGYVSLVVIIAIGIGLGYLWHLGIGVLEDDSFPLIGIFAVVFTGMGIAFIFLMPYFVNMIPMEAAFTANGVYFKYWKPTKFLRLQSTSWKDIKEVPSEELLKMTPPPKLYMIQLKVGDEDHSVYLDPDLQRMFIEQWRYRSAEVAKMAIVEEHREQVQVQLQKVAEQTQDIQWATNLALKKRKNKTLGANILIALLVGLMALLPIYLIITVGFNFAFLAMLFMMLFPLVFIVLLKTMIKTNDVSAVGFSHQGVHFKFEKMEKKNKETAEFVAWDDIKEIIPLIGTRLELTVGEVKKKLEWSDIDNDLLLRMACTLDAHRKCTFTGVPPPPTEVVPNPLYMRFWNLTYYPIFALLLSILFGAVASYFLGFVAIMVTMVVVILLFFAVKEVVPGNRSRLKRAPNAIGLSDAGIYVMYTKAVPPPGATNFIPWNEIARFSTIEDEKEALFGEGIADRPGQKSIIIVKTSGTKWIIGPMDPTMFEKIKGHPKAPAGAH
jgi:hypothetical protein